MLTTFDKAKPLNTLPHCKKEQTVFGKECKGLSYDYSDRLWDWDYDKAQTASSIASESGHVLRSCLWYEAYLTAYFGRPIEIKHIVAGVNVSNGYPYCVFGYRDKAT